MLRFWLRLRLTATPTFTAYTLTTTSKVLATGTVGQLGDVKNETKKFKLDGTEYKADKALTDTKAICPNKEQPVAGVADLDSAITHKDALRCLRLQGC